MFEPISKYGNYFVGVDGEGVGDDYVLLDSSLPDYERLYTGERLSSIACLNWLWGLGKHAGYAVFCFYGANYDFNNIVRDISFEDVQRLVAAQPVRIGDYLVHWMPKYKFEIRRIAAEDVTQPEYAPNRYQYERIRTRHGNERADRRGLELWDVLPFWQSTFERALDKTLGERAIDRELIAEMKAERGAFTHEQIEKLSRYNKSECRNLSYMMVELDNWFYQTGIQLKHWNGPGSAAKAMLRNYQPFMHAGRRISPRSSSVSKRVHEYVFPGADDDRAMLHRALSAYAGGLNRLLKIGYHDQEAWQYDLISAHPSGMVKLPCLSHGRWVRTRNFDARSFGLWKIRYRGSRRMRLYPYFFRLSDGSIEYPHTFSERWVHTTELRAGLAVDEAGTTIIDGWKWEPEDCDNPSPCWWVSETFLQRAAYKRAGNRGAAEALKYPLNSLYGSFAQARGGTRFAPPWAQQLVWAGAITAYSRARLYLAYSVNPDAVAHMATDGIITLEPLNLKIGKGLGEWEVSHMRNLTVIQYGIYAADEEQDNGSWKFKHRERGFHLSDDEVPDFLQRVHDLWRGKSWVSMPLTQRGFVTAGLVAQSEKRYKDWCTWFEVEKKLTLDEVSVFQRGMVKSVPGMYDVLDTSYNIDEFGTSEPYKPKWGKGDDFPAELREIDFKQEALSVAQEV